MSSSNVLTRFVQDTLLKQFAPIVYLHSGETSCPSSAEWYLQYTKLIDGSNKVVSNPALTNLSALGSAPSTCRLELIDKRYRVGTGIDAPFYGQVRVIGDPLSAIDLTYWFFYPFNGNIFDKEKMVRILEGMLVGSIALALNPFTAFAGLALVAAIPVAIDELQKVDGLFMHEGDWEHVTVRLSSDRNTILGIYYAIHNKGRWYTRPATATRLGYKLSADGRPYVYSARQSHASYPYAATITRFGGLADDHTDEGTQWSPTEAIVNITDAAAVLKWLKYPGRWGKKVTARLELAELFKQDVREFENGPTGPATKGTWINGDPNQPPLPNPQSAARIAVIEKCDGPIAVAGYRGFLWVAYLFESFTPDHPDACTVGFATFNGQDWVDIPLRIENASYGQIALAAHNDELHFVYKSHDRLRWATLVLDDANRLPVSWNDRTDAGFIRGNEKPVLAASINSLGLAYETSGGHLFFAEYNGTNWINGPEIVNDFTGDTSSLGVFNGQFCYATMAALPVDGGMQTGVGIFYINRQSASLTPACMLHAGKNINKFALTELDGALHVIFSASSEGPKENLDWARFIEQGVARSTQYDTGHVVPSSTDVAGLGLGSMAVRDTLWAVFSKPVAGAEMGSVWVVAMPCH